MLLQSRPSLALRTLNLMCRHDLHVPILGSKSSLQALQPDTDLGPVLSFWQYRKLPPLRGKAGPPCGLALALRTAGWGQGGWAKLWKAKQGESVIKDSLVHWTVKHRWLKSWLMTDGSATVDVSPRSWSF